MNKVVIGDGLAALSLVAHFAANEESVIWIAGSRVHLASPLAGFSSVDSARILEALASRFGIECGELREESSLREFRNKAFRNPSWLSEKESSSAEGLWAPEKRWMDLGSVRFTLSLVEIEEKLREALLEHPCVRRMEQVPVQKISRKDDHFEILLGSGVSFEAEEVLYADRWSTLKEIEGMPSSLHPLRGRDAAGVLQATLTHSVPVGAGVQESFCAVIHRDPGEEQERRLWGYFSSDGKNSIWTICLASEEGEDNHSVAKKFRKIKSTLDRIFSGSDLVPQGNESISATFAGEQVRFEDEAVFAGGKPLVAPIAIPDLPGFQLFTDCYGPSCSLMQVGKILNTSAVQINT